MPKRSPSVVPTLYVYGPLNGKLETSDRMHYKHEDGLYVRVETIRKIVKDGLDPKYIRIDELLDKYVHKNKEQFQRSSDTCEYVFHHIPTFQKEVVHDELIVKIPYKHFNIPDLLKKCDTFCAILLFIPYNQLSPDDIENFNKVTLQAAYIWASLLSTYSSPEIAQYMFFEQYEFPALWELEDDPNKLCTD